MAALAERRSTGDINVAVLATPAAAGAISRIAAALRTDPGDGLVVDTSAITSEPIRDDTDQPGPRIKITASLTVAHIPST